MEESSEIIKESKKNQPARSLCLRRKYIIAAILFLLFISATLVFSLSQPEPKPDPASEALIRQVIADQLNKDPIELTDNDFTMITSFEPWTYIPYATHFGVSGIRTLNVELSDIKYLEKLTNLQELTLERINTPAKEVPELLKILAKIGIVNPDGRYLIDLSPLRNLTNLKKINLNYSPVENIKPLSNLVNLEELYLRNTKVSNIRPLKRLTKLKKLDIRESDNIPYKQVKELQKALPNIEITR